MKSWFILPLKIIELHNYVIVLESAFKVDKKNYKNKIFTSECLKKVWPKWVKMKNINGLSQHAGVDFPFEG